MAKRAAAESSDRERAIGKALVAIESSYSSQERRRRDPVDVVHDFDDPLDQELVALIAACMAFGKRFEELPARIHQRDDDRGQLLPDDERCCHRQDRDDIEAHFTASQACNNLANKDGQNRNGERRPDTILPRRLSEQRQGKAKCKTECRQ